MRFRTSPAVQALLLLSLASACSGGGGSGGGKRLFVSAGGRGTGDGSSWADATARLQDAIDAAQTGDEVWVAAGTYTPAPPGGDRTASFRLKTGVSVRGGFAGDETSTGPRPGAGPTILSGDLDGDDGPAFSGRAENSYHVVTAFGIDQSGTLENVTVRGGYANGPGKGASPESHDQGAGLDIFNASPRVLRCTFEDNWNENHGAVNDHGIASVFEECVFRANRSAMIGAGLYIHHHSETLAVECVFEDNIAEQQGGGAYCRSHDGAVFQDCEFRRNAAMHGGGIYCAGESTPEIRGCLFEENTGQIGGGGVYADIASPRVADCTFRRNAAGVDILGGGGGSGGSGGGGFWGDGAEPVVEDCHFEDNTASFGGGVYLIFFCNAAVRRCTFVDNHTHEGAGLYTLNSDAYVADCTFERNRVAGATFPVGGGVSNYFSNATYQRCTFVDNSSELGGGGAYAEGEAPRFLECSFVGNRAFNDTEGVGGGILLSFFANAVVQSCSFVGNEANLGGGIFLLAFAEGQLVNGTYFGNRAAHGVGGAIGVNKLAEPHVANTIVWRNEPPGLGTIPGDVRFSCIDDEFAGEGNFASNPQFIAEPAPGPDGRFGTADDFLGDVRLAAGSPCIDAGDNTVLMRGTQLDLGGRPRFRDDPASPDRGIPAPPVVDLGAHER